MEQGGQSRGLYHAGVVACVCVLGGCAPTSAIDLGRNQMAVGARERHGEQQVLRLLREQTEITRRPELVVEYLERMEERLAPSPLSVVLVLGQLEDSADAWARFFEGTR